MITGIAHLCLTVNDLERSIAFYRDVLGLREAFAFIRDTGEKHGAYLHAGARTFIEMFIGDVPEDAKDDRYRHVCLEVDDLEATVADIRARGGEVSDPKLGKDQSWQAWVTDPDGNRIEFHQYTPESWQAPSLA